MFFVLNILKKLREVLVENYLNKDDKFSGPGVIIEIDESKFG
jgi:hypothetical protein